jgi:hypothetical protein
VPSFDAKEKTKFRIVQLKSTVVKSNYVHMINTLQLVSLIPVVNSTFHYTLLNFRITIDFHCVHIVSTKCSQRGVVGVSTDTKGYTP